MRIQVIGGLSLSVRPYISGFSGGSFRPKPREYNYLSITASICMWCVLFFSFVPFPLHFLVSICFPSGLTPLLQNFLPRSSWSYYSKDLCRGEGALSESEFPSLGMFRYLGQYVFLLF